MTALIDSLGAHTGIVCAVGAGGKKSVLYQLAREHSGHFALTATVHTTVFPDDLEIESVIHDDAELAGCIALPGNEPPLVNFEGPKEVEQGVFEIPFEIIDPDEGDEVTIVSISADFGNAEIVGDVIRYTLATPLSKDTNGLVEVTIVATDSGSCEGKAFKTTIQIGVAGDQVGSGCTLIR